MQKLSSYFETLTVIFFILLNSFVISSCTEGAAKTIYLEKEGIVGDFKFEVGKDFLYYFSLSFHFPENNLAEQKRVRKILGGFQIDKNGKLLEPGTPTPLNLKIFATCRDGREVEVYSTDIDPILTSWDSRSYNKEIGNHSLTQGMYRAQVTNKRATSDFAGIPITFEFGMPAKVDYISTTDNTWRKLCTR